MIHKLKLISWHSMNLKLRVSLCFCLSLTILAEPALGAGELFRRPESLSAVPSETVGQQNTAASAVANSPEKLSSSTHELPLASCSNGVASNKPMKATIQNNDLVIVERLIKAYQFCAAKGEAKRNPMWQTFFDTRHKSLHNVFVKGNVNDAAEILRNPGSSDLFYGFDNLTVSILPKFDCSSVRQTHAAICLDHLVRFAEAIGAISIDNPETHGLTPSPFQWKADSIIPIISKKLDIQISFPNPYPQEHGLLTSCGVMSYRVPQALYQAYRIKEVLKNIKNPRVLEIGAGLGRTAYYARLLGIQDYTIVDLPFTGMSSGYFLGVTLGEDQILLPGESKQNAKNRIKLLTPAEFLANNERYDLIINADGFTELDPNVAKTYLNHIQNISPIFLSINHESNDYSLRGLIDQGNYKLEIERHPYWMRPGYVEEVIRFK